MKIKSQKYYFSDFTESNYKKLLKLAKKYYSFKLFGNYINSPYVIWRHDLDCSVHRALKLAKIEHDLGISSTYFLHLHSQFYNLFEKEIYDKIKKIIHLGHNIGLHFELGFYEKTKSKKEFERLLSFEKKILQNLFNIDVKVFSFHNPDFANSMKFNDDKIAGMINTYGKSIIKNHYYCSDSNGYWRFRRLEEILKEHKELKLQVLTHPEWWQKYPMSPQKRINRCIDIRSKRTKEFYKKTLKQLNRKNIL